MPRLNRLDIQRRLDDVEGRSNIVIQRNRVQRKASSGAPTHVAMEGILCWNDVDHILYVSQGGGTWTALTVGGGTAVSSDQIWDALGDVLYGTGADTGARLAGNTTTTKKFLSQTGDGAASAAPAWSTVDEIVDADSDTKIQVEESADEDIIRFDAAGTEMMTLGADGLDIFHTAAGEDEHAVEMDVDAAGHGDVKALDIDYITGAIAAGEDEGIILINIDEIAATGGDVFGLEVLATDGGADGIYALKAGAVVGPILQESGVFANPTTGTNDTPSTDVPDMIDGSAGTNTTIFVANDDYILIGAAAAFTEIEFIIETGAANPGVKPTFGYSTAGSHQFTTFSPVDGTNGFRNTGVVAWDAADLTGHTTNDDTGTYDIKITRTHAVAGSVSLFYAKTAETVVYSWDKDGKVSIAVAFLAEQAAADADVAGKGQIWVKTATPNELWFTDDAGTDVQLGTGDGGGSKRLIVIRLDSNANGAAKGFCAWEGAASITIGTISVITETQPGNNTTYTFKREGTAFDAGGSGGTVVVETTETRETTTLTTPETIAPGEEVTIDISGGNDDGGRVTAYLWEN